MNAARKLRKKHTKSRSAQKKNRSRHQDNSLGASHAKGIVLHYGGIEAKHPNFGIRRCVRVHLIKSGEAVTCFVPYDGGLKFVEENDEVLIAGIGKRGKSGDIPEVKYKVVKVAGVSLKALVNEKVRGRGRI